MPYKDPEKRRAAVRESCRRHRAGLPRKPGKPDRKPELAELRYKTMGDLLAVLGEEIDRVRDASLPVEQRARVLAYLVGTAARLIEGADLESRLAEVEAILQRINKGGDHGETGIRRNPPTA